MLYAGLDLSRKRLDFCLLDQLGEKVEVGTAPPDADGLRSLTTRVGRFGEPGMFVLGDENELRRLLEETDFAHIRIEAVPVHFDYADVDDYIRRANETGGMFARAWSAAPEAEQEAMRDEFREAFAPFVVDGGYELTGLALCALAS